MASLPIQDSAKALPPIAAAGNAETPAPWVLLLIFWGAFAAAVMAMQVFTPAMFERQDPDSLMRLVQVRDLLGGQGWFDLVQHRLNPPDGLLMHWSRLIDAPIAGLALLGGVFGNGAAFAVAAWPLLLLLAFMASAMAVATALAGPAAVVPTLLLALVFFDPLLSFLPGSIDHHNAQLVVLVATLAAAMRLPRHAGFGLAAGALCGLSLAIGLEMLPFVALFGAAIALHWAWTGTAGRATMAFGAAFGASPTLLHLAAGSPEAPMVCDALSYAYAIPAALAGFGLAAIVWASGRAGSPGRRVSALAALAAAIGGAVLLVAPNCLAGPYGALPLDLQRLWLSTITEAQPLITYFTREPDAIIALLGPPLAACVVAFRRVRHAGREGAYLWLLPALVIALAIAMSFYQVRTLPAANAAAIPLLGAWLAQLIARHGVTSLRPLRRALPVILAALIAMPATHLAYGWGAVKLVSLGGGRVAPVERPDAPKHVVAGMTEAEKDCIDPHSAKLLASVRDGLILAPVFYGSSILALSGHSAVAAPYHRGGPAILDAIRAMDLPPDEARAIAASHRADYVAICSTSRESALTVAEAPNGLLAHLLSGGEVAWLDPAAADAKSALRLWRVIN